MKRLLTLMLIVSCICLLASAQQSTPVNSGHDQRGLGQQQPEIVFHPEETIHVALKFEHPAKLGGFRTTFQLQTAVTEGQRALPQSLHAQGALTEIAPGEYEASFKVPKVASGKYKMNWIGISNADGSGNRDYTDSTGLPDPLEIRIQNPEHVDIPDLKQLSLMPDDKREAKK